MRALHLEYIIYSKLALNFMPQPWIRGQVCQTRLNKTTCCSLLTYVGGIHLRSRRSRCGHGYSRLSYLSLRTQIGLRSSTPDAPVAGAERDRAPPYRSLASITSLLKETRLPTLSLNSVDRKLNSAPAQSDERMKDFIRPLFCFSNICDSVLIFIKIKPENSYE